MWWWSSNKTLKWCCSDLFESFSTGNTIKKARDLLQTKFGEGDPWGVYSSGSLNCFPHKHFYPWITFHIYFKFSSPDPHIIPFIAILSNNISKFHLVPRAAHKTCLDQLDKVWVLKQHWGMTVIQSSQWCVILAFLLKYPVLAYMLHMGWENQSCSNYQIVYKFSWIDHNTGLSTGIL